MRLPGGHLLEREQIDMLFLRHKYTVDNTIIPHLIKSFNLLPQHLRDLWEAGKK